MRAEGDAFGSPEFLTGASAPIAKVEQHLQ
jgi:hypothetical protein